MDGERATRQGQSGSRARCRATGTLARGVFKFATGTATTVPYWLSSGSVKSFGSPVRSRLSFLASPWLPPGVQEMKPVCTKKGLIRVLFPRK